MRRLKLLLIAAVLSPFMFLTGCSDNPNAPDSNSLGLGIFSRLFSNSVWSAMSDDMRIIPNDRPQILQSEIKWYAARKRYIEQLTHNASPYIYYVYQQTRIRHMPAEIALLPMVENNYDPFGNSGVGANGLWQMMPGTASGYGIKIDWWYDGRRDVVASTQAALDYLVFLHKFFQNDWLLAIAAYDSGQGTVLNAIRHNQKLHKPTDFWDLPLPQETEHYVPKLLALSIIISNASDYGVKLPKVPDSPYFGAVSLNFQLGIDTIAKLADTQTAVIRQLNPGFRRWATLPQGQYELLLPVDRIAVFNKNLKALPKADRVSWQHYRVQSGDTLIAIANKFHTSVEIIKQVNSLKSNMLHLQQTLLIPQNTHGNIAGLIPHGHSSSRLIAEDRLPGPQKFIHTVSNGQNLWSLAKLYGVKPAEILFWNNLNDKHLHPGQRIIIWLAPHSEMIWSCHDYYVKHGDTLIGIAHQYHMSPLSLKHMNHMPNDFLRIGQKLCIPYHHYVQVIDRTVAIHHRIASGDTLYGIAKEYHVSIDDLLRWNHLKSGRYLHIGERILIYQHQAEYR